MSTAKQPKDVHFLWSDAVDNLEATLRKYSGQVMGYKLFAFWLTETR